MNRRSLAAIAGIGELKPERRTFGATTLELIAETVRLAVEDAGLEKDDIDGLLVGPQVGETPQHVPATVTEYLGIAPRMSNVVDLGGASGAGMVWRAAAAIQMGMCDAVVCVLANHREEQLPRSPNRNPIREFDVPFGASGANISYALPMQRHMAEYGSTPEQFASIAAWARQNAQLNPNAIFYGKPATVEDVLASPIITSPLHLYEIVMPVAGGEAVVVVSPERARTLKHAPVHLLGAGEKLTHRAISQAPSLTSGPLKFAMAQAMAQAGVTVDQMSLLSFYDCYTVMVAMTIEDAGLCEPGQFGNWLSERNLSHRGDFPLNTHGGQLGFGQPDLAGGMTHIVEAVRQLRHEAIGRQIENARLSLITGNGATISEAVALVLGADE
ncbi:acetyl-CoA acetyltransferase [Paraburkholderia ginsengiterrae]|uniref:Acetyl-CoA acetyltransferase n=1 Tax=Paraburkholderia ginsengiterrae TaxID=1462993 RepID=A0A1A9N282_9BURK|nr:thiolase family protein [Paraburkholderia ginsengiterrae]OAJ55993.1 acetyl-CoA acetyltransferase [Paraburkholderia ginsengiterrae]OAJ58550.1 acetyl-CoA acetyltransferase [Paraburkholderia ginsengiterrae]